MSFDAYHVDDATDAEVQKEIDEIFETCWSINHQRRQEVDAMTDEPSPRPWRVNGHSIEANDPEGLWLQNEKTGWGVVANLPSCPKSRMSKKNRETWDAIVEANATLIVNAVNERDHLRDLVRRLTHVAQDTLDFAKAMCGIIPDNPERAKARSEVEGLLSEARAAIGEDVE